MKTKPKKKPFNVRLLREVKQAILDNPSQFYMGNWFSQADQVGQPAGGCGTSACIAGWAIHLKHGKKRLNETNRLFVQYEEAEVESFKVLRLSAARGRRLFYQSEWPERFCQELDRVMTAEEAATVAARRIDHFIKTNGRA